MNTRTARQCGPVQYGALIIFASCMLGSGCKNEETQQPAAAEGAAKDTAAKDTAPEEKPAAEAAPVRFTVFVNEHELWTGCADSTSASCKAAQKIAACDGAIDAAALATSLCEMARNADNTRYVEIEVSAPKDTRLQRLVTVMDAIGSAGFRRIAMVSQDAMATKLPGDNASPTAPALCGQPPPRCNAPVVVNDVLPPPVALDAQPLLIISATEIRLDKTVLSSIEEFLADPGKALPGIQAALTQARQDSGSSSIIVQADKNTAAEVLMPVLEAADTAGFEDVSYAIKKTPAQ